VLMATVASTVALLGALGGIVSPDPTQLATGAGTLAPPTTQTYIAAAANYTQAKNNGPIRECFGENCKPVGWLQTGLEMTWDHFANNQEGHRWYYVTSFHTSQNGHVVTNNPPVKGWIYCENITAPC
jgi:hypothetical protein